MPRVLNAVTIAPRAWAGNTINTSIYRHQGVLTVERTQWTAFYLDARRLRVVQRDLQTDELACPSIGTCGGTAANGGIRC